jgi:hypothetical protein
MRRWIAGLTLALAAAPAAAQEAATPAPKVTLQEVGHALNGMDLVYAELRQALRQRDSIYRELVVKVLALPDPNREMPRDDLEAALRTARAEAARAQGEAVPLDGRIAATDTRYAEFVAIAKSRYQVVLDALDRR